MEAQPDLFATRSIALIAARATDKGRDELLRNRFFLGLLIALLSTWLEQLSGLMLAVSFLMFIASLLGSSREASRELCLLTKCKPLDNFESAYDQKKVRGEGMA